MKKVRWSPILVAAMLLAVAVITEASQPTKIPQIGVLEPATSASISARIEAFRQGLRELGYVEGKNITIEYRYADGKSERIPDLAAELVNLKVDIIVTSQTPTVLAIKKVSSTMPIVFFFLSFPEENGIVASFARPGGNATGLTVLSEELNGKRLELLKDASPTIKRVGVLSNPDNPTQPLEWKGIQAAAVTLGLRLQSLNVRNAADLKAAFKAALKQRAQALINLPEAVFTMNRKRITEFATENKLPAMCSDPQAVEGGCLMSYSPNQLDLYRRGATYVDKILKGVKPADIPVEQPTKFELVINLKAAKQIGLTVPQRVLLKADRVIK
jgi:putative tryptophan/tyrosine transport system substrate-binding protein